MTLPAYVVVECLKSKSLLSIVSPELPLTRRQTVDVVQQVFTQRHISSGWHGVLTRLGDGRIGNRVLVDHIRSSSRPADWRFPACTYSSRERLADQTRRRILCLSTKSGGRYYYDGSVSHRLHHRIDPGNRPHIIAGPAQALVGRRPQHVGCVPGRCLASAAGRT